MTVTDRAPWCGAGGWELGKIDARDLLGVLLALVIWLPLILCPFTRDQYVFMWMGAHWLDGSWPYSDLVDTKPPLIFAWNALAQLLFGRSTIAIRLLDMISAIGTGVMVAHIVAFPRPVKAGEWGLSILVTTGLYGGLMSWFGTAQVEFPMGVCLLLGWHYGRQGGVRAAAQAGLWVALACCWKTPAVVAGLYPFGLVMWRTARGSRLRAGFIFVAAGLGITAICVAPFALTGRLWDLYEVQILMALRYAADPPVRMLWDWWWTSYTPLFWQAMSVLLLVSFISLPPRTRLPNLHWPLMFGALVATVAFQGRYSPYHWGMILPFLGAMMVWALAQGGRNLNMQWILALLALGGALLEAELYVPTPYPGSFHQTWWSAVEFARGEQSREVFHHQFRTIHLFNVQQQEEVVATLNHLARPGDHLYAPGYEPYLYLGTGMEPSSRFFADSHLKWQPAPPEWTDEHREALLDLPPAFVVLRDEVLQRGSPFDWTEITGRGYIRGPRVAGFWIWIKADHPAAQGADWPGIAPQNTGDAG